MSSYIYYDHGWNSRVRGELFIGAHRATRDWRDGWRDADEAISSGEKIEEMDFEQANSRTLQTGLRTFSVSY